MPIEAVEQQSVIVDPQLVLEAEMFQQDVDAIRLATRDSTILVVPGLGGSGPQHWQTLWEPLFPNVVRVGQDNWGDAQKPEWVKKLDAAIEEHGGDGDGRIILVGYSLACPTIAHWADEHPQKAKEKIKAAMLVAPADVARKFKKVNGFSPPPLNRLPFDATVVGSRNDAIVSFDRAQLFARSWGAHFEDVGARGHINAKSGLGIWPQGIRFLRELVERPAK